MRYFHTSVQVVVLLFVFLGKVKPIVTSFAYCERGKARRNTAIEAHAHFLSHHFNLLGGYFYYQS